MGSKFFSLLLPEQLHTQLKEVCFRSGEHASKIIRRALVKELEVIQKQGQHESKA